MWTHELSTGWPVFLAIAVVALWSESSRRADFKRRRETQKEIEDAYERGYQHGRATAE
jgi:hypothetical protein